MYAVIYRHDGIVTHIGNLTATQADTVKANLLAEGITEVVVRKVIKK